MTRECHAGICGSRGLRCPRPPDRPFASIIRGSRRVMRGPCARRSSGPRPWRRYSPAGRSDLGVSRHSANAGRSMADVRTTGRAEDPVVSSARTSPYLSTARCQALESNGHGGGVVSGGRWRVRWAGVVRAGARPYFGPRSGLVPGRRHDGRWGESRWGKRCGRSFFLGRPRGVGRRSPGAGRGASV